MYSLYGLTGGTAHPRSRGEHDVIVINHLPTYGSSPLARGTPMVNHLYTLIYRLIPARAGNTC